MEKITIKIPDGLCNRLRTLYPFLEYCEINSYKLNVIWPINKFCESSYNSVFDSHDNLNFIDEKKKKAHIDYCGHSPPDYLLKLLNNSNYYKFFSPNESIKNQVYSLTKDIDSTFNSIHIRRTDHIGLAKKNKVFTEDSTFIKYIEDSKYPVYLATDCNITQKKFLQYFGSKVFVYKLIDQGIKLRQTSLEHSVIDIIMCSLSNNFMGSGYSSFSDLIYSLRQHKNDIPFYYDQ